MGFWTRSIYAVTKGSLQLHSTFTKRILRPVAFFCTETTDTPVMDLSLVTRRLQSIAPTSLAESWDNVGLLLEPSPPHEIKVILLTNDLTEAVMQEALDQGANMIISYHPPIFKPLKCLTQRQWKERIIIRCLENRVALYSPHTTYDVVKDGLSDWLISPFEGRVEPIQQTAACSYPTQGKHGAEFLLGPDILGHVVVLDGVDVTVSQSTAGDEELQRVHCCCTDKGLVRLMELLGPYSDVRETLQITSLSKPPLPGHGAGRLCKLKEPTTLGRAVEAVKAHLKLPHLRLAVACGCTQASKVKTVAVCAGSGGSTLQGVNADLYITGEMSHHEVLEATARGSSVILAEHSNTERGYLAVLQTKLSSLFDGKVNVIISDKDADPLQII